MKKVNINDIKAHISSYVPQLQKGASFLLCKRNRPIAEIRGIPSAPEGQKKRSPRKLGFAKGTFKVGPEFFEDLPKDVLEGFEGKFS